MKRRNKVIISVLLVIIPLLVYLLYPITDERYHFTFDQKKIQLKEALLRSLRQGAKKRSTGPNVIIILADDLSKHDLALHNGPVKTPHIEKLASEGVTFSEAYCTSPVCSPSRAGLLTGRYPQKFGYEYQPMNRYPKNRLEYGVYRNFILKGDWVPKNISSVPKDEDKKRQGLPPSELTSGEIYQSLGYKTAIVGKWHLGHYNAFLPHRRGFDSHYGFYEAFSLFAPLHKKNIVNHRHSYFASKHIWAQERKGTSAIRRNNKEIKEERYLTFAIADETTKFIEKNKNKAFYLYVPFSAPHTPFQAPKRYVKKFSHIKDKNKRVYYAMIAALDDAVGTIMKSLKDNGLDKNTVVFFSSDNGGATYTNATNNGPLKGGKFSQFEGGLNVPMIMRWKGRIPQGTRYSKPVSLMDITATSFHITHKNNRIITDYLKTIDGKNLMPYITGKAKGDVHEALYWKTGRNRAIRKGRWKLLVDDNTGEVQLYKLKKDLVEDENLAKTRPQIVKELLIDLDAWTKKLPGAKWPNFMSFRFRHNGKDYFFDI